MAGRPWRGFRDTGCTIAVSIWHRARLLPMLALFTGCAPPNSAGREATLTVAYPLEDWEYRFTDDATQFLVFLPLVARNAHGELEGRLADWWEHAADYRTWTVHLRQDIRWHDGTPVTANDVEFTLNLLTGPSVQYAAPRGFQMRVLDDSTYSISYDHVTGDAVGWGSPQDDYTVYYPKHLLKDLDPAAFESWEFWSHPVGNGPYRFVRQVPHTMMEFTANPDHYRGKPRIERLILKYTNEESTELLSGNVNAVSYATRRFTLARADDDRFRAYHAIDPDHNRVVAWNLRHHLFADRAVRRALTLAIDRAELHQVLGLPEETPLFDVPVSGGQFRRGELPAPIPFDPDQAASLLDRAGWRVAETGGIRSRDGRPFRFTLLAVPFRQGEAVYIQNQLRRVGVDVTIQSMEWSVVRERVTAGEFEAALFVANASLDSPIGVLPFFGSESFIGYANAEVISLLSDLRRTIDPDEVDRIHRRMAPLLMRDLPVIYLYPNTETSIAVTRLRGLSTPYRADLLRYMDELWLDERDDR